MMSMMANEARLAKAQGRQVFHLVYNTPLPPQALEGKYFVVDPIVEVLPDGRGRVRVRPSQTGAAQDGTGIYTFDWQTGAGAVHWE